MVYKLSKLIAAGEIAREKEQNDLALELLDRAIDQAAIQKDYNALLAALGHKLLVWKHEFQKTNEYAFLELMVADARAGYQIGVMKKVSKDALATPLLRIGHYHFLRKQFKEAEVFFKLALRMVDKRSAGRYAEFLGHYGFSAAFAGKTWKPYFQKAQKLLEHAEDLRPFHKLVVESGIYMRMAVIAAHMPDKKTFRINLDKAGQLAQVLKTKYKINLRAKQVNRLAKEPKWIF